MSSSLFTLTLFLLMKYVNAKASYAASLPGETIPTWTEIQIGGSANITCQMNLLVFDGKNSSSMYFVEKETGRKVPSSDIAIINENTIVYMMRNAKVQNGDYYCKCGKDGIGITHISVGTVPPNITDFMCRSHDYEYMVCNFSIPKNTVLTKYNLTYMAHSPNYLQNCTLEVKHNQGICNLSMESGTYRPTYKFYNFTLTGSNALGVNSQSFWINHYESVIPPRPKFRFVDITTNSVVVSWQMYKYSQYKSKGLQYEIKIRPKNFDWQNHSNYEIRYVKSEDKLELTVRNLPYAYYWYMLSVRMKVKTAYNDDTMWSEAFVDSFQTKATRPARPPITDVGSFYIDSTETRIRLYWEQLPFVKENGPNFRYVVTQVLRDGVPINATPIEIDRTSALFSWNKNHKYEFTIKSCNDAGESPGNSTITVPVYPIIPSRNTPSSIKTVYNAANRTYTLSWSPPYTRTDVLDYTVFWCESKRANSNECQGTIRFTRLDRRSNSYTTEPQMEENTLSLAVSANYENLNTGMHWTACTADVTSDLVKLELQITEVTGHTIGLQWSSDQLCTSHIEGYNLTYCEIDITSSNQTLDPPRCAGKNVTTTIEGTIKKYTLRNLKPFTSYKIEMFMYSKLKVGKISYKLVKTIEDAPSAPRSLKYYNVTSNSAWISWMSPAQTNGKIRFYTVVQNSEQHFVNCTLSEFEDVCYNNNNNNSTNMEIRLKLENLSSFTNYKIYVTATTVKASPPSNDIHLRTLIGIPSNPRHMVSNDQNHTLMQWLEPEVPSGRVEFYEVAAIVWYKKQMHKMRITGVVGSTACIINIPVCWNKDYEFSLQVRAVNVVLRGNEIDQALVANGTEKDPDAAFYQGNDDLKCIGIAKQESVQADIVQNYRNTNKYIQYKSAWEKGPNYGCAPPTGYSSISIILWIFFLLSMLFVLAFSGYFAAIKVIQMSHIDIDLPPGLYLKDNEIITRDDDDSLRSKESLYKNERDRLLSSISNDIGFMGSDYPAVHGSQMYPSSSIATSSGYIEADPITEDIALPHDSNKIQIPNTTTTNDAYMVMDVLKQHRPNHSPNKDLTYVQLDNNGYVLQSTPEVCRSAKVFTPNQSVILAANGYVKPNQIFNITPQSDSTRAHAAELPVDSNGYVTTQQLLQNASVQPSFDGYTRLDALGKSIIGSPPTQSTTSPAPSFGGALPPISGYVTHKELSAFGQQTFS